MLKESREAAQQISMPEASVVPIDERANWRTHAEMALGFSIKYPFEWRISESQDNRKDIGSDFRFFSREPGGQLAGFYGINVDTSNKSLEEFATSLFANDEEKIVSTKEILVDNQPAILIDTNDYGQKYIVTKRNEKIYTIQTDGFMIESGMLDTFKFITTKNLKFANTTGFGYELTIPSHWTDDVLGAGGDRNYSDISRSFTGDQCESGPMNGFDLMTISHNGTDVVKRGVEEINAELKKEGAASLKLKTQQGITVERFVAETATGIRNVNVFLTSSKGQYHIHGINECNSNFIEVFDDVITTFRILP